MKNTASPKKSKPNLIVSEGRTWRVEYDRIGKTFLAMINGVGCKGEDMIITQPNQTETTADPLAPPALTFLGAVASADRAATVTKTPWYVVKADGSYHIGDADDLICYWPACVAKYSTVTGALECCPDCGDPVDGACAACLEDSAVLAPVAESVEG